MTVEDRGRGPGAEDRAGWFEPGTGTALGLFERRLQAGPARPMIYTEDATLNAADADRLSGALASALRERGVGRGDRVGLMLQNDPQFPIAQLAIWRCGAIAVPLNPMLRARELAQQLGDTVCSALICLHELAGEAVPAARQSGVKHIAITDSRELIDGTHPAPVAGTESLADWLATAPGAALVPHPSDTAVITYTSGTTGAPKGVCSSHANLVWAAQVYREWVALDESTVVLGAAPLFHVTGQVGHLAVADLLAAPVVLDHRFDARRLLIVGERFGATFLVAAATAFRALMAVGEPAPSSLNRLVLGAQSVSPALIDQVQEWSGCYGQNIYGMTETTSPALAVPLGQRAPVDPETGALSVGRPVSATRTMIADPQTGEPLPPGTPGELLIAGPQVTAGYWRRPEADADAFRAGWLRSGDLAVADENGWYFLLDRIKDLINASGFKVSPREVEEVLMGFPEVHDAAVVGEPDEYRGEQVVAFVTPADGHVDVNALRDHCRQNLASYKCPRVINVVREIPRTASSKTLRRSLRGEGPA